MPRPTTIRLLTAHKGHFEAVKKLLGGGAAIDATTNTNRTALHAATEKGYLEVVNVLLESGARIDLITAAALTPLDAPRSSHHQSVVELLTATTARLRNRYRRPYLFNLREKYQSMFTFPYFPLPILSIACRLLDFLAYNVLFVSLQLTSWLNLSDT